MSSSLSSPLLFLSRGAAGPRGQFTRKKLMQEAPAPRKLTLPYPTSGCPISPHSTPPLLTAAAVVSSTTSFPALAARHPNGAPHLTSEREQPAAEQTTQDCRSEQRRAAFSRDRSKYTTSAAAALTGVREGHSRRHFAGRANSFLALCTCFSIMLSFLLVLSASSLLGALFTSEATCRCPSAAFTLLSHRHVS